MAVYIGAHPFLKRITIRRKKNQPLPDQGKRHSYKGNGGFTLIEIMVVMVILSIFAMITVPRLTRIFSNQRDTFAVLTGIIVKTFDDSFLNNRTNYLMLHLKNSAEKDDESKNSLFQRRNGISILNMVDGTFQESKRKILRFREFSDSFVLEEVLLQNGEKITEGNVLIPFYPAGFSNDAIIHIMVNGDEQWSVRIYKHMKEPDVIEGYINFESNPE